MSNQEKTPGQEEKGPQTNYLDLLGLDKNPPPKPTKHYETFMSGFDYCMNYMWDLDTKEGWEEVRENIDIPEIRLDEDIYIREFVADGNESVEQYSERVKEAVLDFLKDKPYINEVIGTWNSAFYEGHSCVGHEIWMHFCMEMDTHPNPSSGYVAACVQSMLGNFEEAQKACKTLADYGFIITDEDAQKYYKEELEEYNRKVNNG